MSVILVALPSFIERLARPRRSGPATLESLNEMLAACAAKLVSVWPRLQSLGWGFDMTGKDAATPEEWRGTLGLLDEVCAGTGWLDLRAHAARLLQHAEAGERGESMMALAEDLRQAFQNKLSSTHVVILEERDTDIYVDAAKATFGGPLHPSLSIPEEEFNLAGKALAVGLSTSSVAHAMRSVEASLHVLCTYINISFPGGIQLQDWLVLTERIESEIHRREQQPRSAQKSEQLKRLAEVAIPANDFRLAWRNHVAHAREKYEAEEARVILGHVAEYLKQLSAAL